MCGIFGYIGENSDAGSIVLEGLKSLDYRGYDSWGIAVLPAKAEQIPQSPIWMIKKAGKIGNANIPVFPKGSCAFGHTRWATHGSVTDANAHPHLDCTKTIALIHNGIIENYLEIKKKLVKSGHIFISETDTEVAVHLIEEYSKSMLMSKAVQKAFNEMTGLNAFIVLSAADNKLIAVRNGSPLVVGYGETRENFVASDAPALLPYTHQVHYLEDNQMAIVGEQHIQIFDTVSGDEVKPIKQLITWTREQTEKGKYPFFMLKEIHEQPGLIVDIASTGISPAENLAKKIRATPNVYFIGCGTASHACLSAVYLLSVIAKRNIRWMISSEFIYRSHSITPNTLVIALSQSGETIDTLEALRIAKNRGAKRFAMVNVVGSAIYRECTDKLLISAGPEKSVASTKAFTCKLAHIILTAYALIHTPKKGQEVLIRAVNASKSILLPSSTDHIKSLAHKIAKARDIFIIGRGLTYAIARETALKIKEISYIHAEGLAAGELKHGPLALITRGVPCIVFLPHDETYDANLLSAMEMKARGGMIIGISEKPNPIFDFHISVPDIGIGTIIPETIVGQLLAYYLAIERGYDPDKPRNLAKSVTVK